MRARTVEQTTLDGNHTRINTRMSETNVIALLKANAASSSLTPFYRLQAMGILQTEQIFRNVFSKSF